MTKVTTVDVPCIFPIKASIPIVATARIAQTVAILAIILGIHWTKRTQRHPRPRAISRLHMIDWYICKKFIFDCKLAVLTNTLFWVVLVGAQNPPNLAKLTVVEYIELLEHEVTTEFGLHINCTEPAVGHTLTHTLFVILKLQRWCWWGWENRRRGSWHWHHIHT